MSQQRWSSFPKVRAEVIESIAHWKMDDIDSVPKGGPQGMQEETLNDLYTLIRHRPDLTDLVVRGIEAGLLPADNYVRDMASPEIKAFWAGTVRFLKTSMTRFAIELLDTIEQSSASQSCNQPAVTVHQDGREKAPA